MRFLYATAIGFAGTALIASPLMRPRAQTADPAPLATVQRTAPAGMEPSADPPDVRPSAVQIVDELVTADTLAVSTSPAAPQRRPAARRLPPPSPRRSLFARVLLGSGEHQPRPFPHPGR